MAIETNFEKNAFENYSEIQNGIVTLETYPADYSDDTHLVEFKVKLSDFIEFINRYTDWEVDDFFKNWIWDDLMDVPEDLEKLGVLISKETKSKGDF